MGEDKAPAYKLITYAGLLMKKRERDISGGLWRRDIGMDVYFATIRINTPKARIMHISCKMIEIGKEKAGEIKRELEDLRDYAETVLARQAWKGVGREQEGGEGIVDEDNSLEVSAERPAYKTDAQGELTLESDISQGFWTKNLETGSYYACVTINIPRKRCVQMVFEIGGIGKEKADEIKRKIEGFKDCIEEILAG